MYSILFYIFLTVLCFLAVFFVVKFYKRSKKIIPILFSLFIMTLSSSALLAGYYFHYYLGNNDEIIQNIYFSLFYISLIFLITLIIAFIYKKIKNR